MTTNKFLFIPAQNKFFVQFKIAEESDLCHINFLNSDGYKINISLFLRSLFSSVIKMFESI